MFLYCIDENKTISHRANDASIIQYIIKALLTLTTITEACSSQNFLKNAREKSLSFWIFSNFARAIDNFGETWVIEI